MGRVECAAADAERLAAYAKEFLGPPSAWRPAPPGYSDGLALCVIDAIWSMGVRYTTVENVLDCYRTSRREDGGDPHRDGVSDLIEHYKRIGGAEQFATKVKNRQRVSTHRGAVLKAEAIYQAALGLQEAGIETCAELRAAATGPDEVQVKSVWLRVPGQPGGTS